MECKICESQTSKTEEYSICQSCGTLRTFHSYDESIYNEDYFKSCVGYINSPINTPLNLSRLGILSRFLSGYAKVLDIGCNTGEFLRFAEKYYKCYGVEPNQTAVAFANSRCGNTTIFNNLNGEVPKVNAITLFDVIEHVEDPKDFLLALSKYLLPKGCLLITTPNVSAAGKHVTSWKHFKPKEHLWLFSALGVETLLAQCGFKTVYEGYEESDIRPGNPNRDIVTVVGRKL